MTTSFLFRINYRRAVDGRRYLYTIPAERKSVQIGSNSSHFICLTASDRLATSSWSASSVACLVAVDHTCRDIRCPAAGEISRTSSRACAVCGAQFAGSAFTYGDYPSSTRTKIAKRSE